MFNQMFESTFTCTCSYLFFVEGVVGPFVEKVFHFIYNQTFININFKIYNTLEIKCFNNISELRVLKCLHKIYLLQQFIKKNRTNNSY